jgi:hypothetical protein
MFQVFFWENETFPTNTIFQLTPNVQQSYGTQFMTRGLPERREKRTINTDKYGDRTQFPVAVCSS